MTVTIFLYQTENPENLGSIARAASNFDFHDIVLIDPKCEISQKSKWLAKHGLPTLEKMRVASVEELNKMDIIVATSGRNSTGYNLVRSPLTPRLLTERIAAHPDKCVGILFGPEGEGLPVEMLQRADIILSIPTSRNNPSMNLAQSVTVVLYELSLLTGAQNKITLPYRSMNKEEHDALLTLIDKTLAKMHFKTEKQRETQKLVWRRMVGRSFLTKRECFSLMGYFKKVGFNYEEKLLRSKK